MASMTKEELKSALINHGISPPPASAKKDEFVALYEEHVAPVDNNAGEFSDDEVTISPRKKPSQSSVKSSTSNKSAKGRRSNGETSEVTSEETSLVAGDVNVDEIDDDQLRSMLQENGVDVGPIVDSTRTLYKKKIALILRGENGILNGTANEFSDTEPETEPEDDQPSLVTTPNDHPVTRSKTSNSSKKSSSPSKKAELSVAGSPLEGGLRKRFNMTADELDTSVRDRPTPRRSIHTYKVTETTRQTIVLNKDGVEHRDTTHTLEKLESKGEEEPRSSRPLKWVLLILVVLLVLGALFHFMTNQFDSMSVENIMKSVEKSIKGSPSAAPTEAPPQETIPSPPPRAELPEQGATADV